MIFDCGISWKTMEGAYLRITEDGVVGAVGGTGGVRVLGREDEECQGSHTNLLTEFFGPYFATVIRARAVNDPRSGLEVMTLSHPPQVSRVQDAKIHAPAASGVLPLGVSLFVDGMREDHIHFWHFHLEFTLPQRLKQ